MSAGMVLDGDIWRLQKGRYFLPSRMPGLGSGAMLIEGCEVGGRVGPGM